MVKDCIISHYNQLMQGENSRDTRFQNGCLLFSQYYTGSDKQNKRKLYTILKSTENSTKFGIINQKNDVKVLLIELNKTV